MNLAYLQDLGRWGDLETGEPCEIGSSSGPGAQYWQQVQAWAASLLERQRWLPLLKPQDGALLPYRAPVWDSEEDAALFEHFVKVMPGCALSPWRTPRKALSEAMDRLLEEEAERRLGLLSLKVPARWPADARGWLEAHAGLGSLAADRSAVALARELLNWSQRLTGGAQSWRTCFTLREPGPDQDSWTLEFALQPRAEPSLIVAAEQVWSGEAFELARSSGHPLSVGAFAELLLTDLGRAQQWSPPIALALSERHPVEAHFTLPEVSAFLQETVWLLQESGFGVRLPAFLTRGRPRLKLRTASKAASGGPEKLMTLDRITRFHWEAEAGGETLSPEALRELARAKQPLVRWKGQWIYLEPSTARLLLDQVQQPAAPLGETLRKLATELEVEVDYGEVLGRLDQAATLTELPEPAGLQAQLRHYQRRGYSWLVFLAERGLGACLADDMGLGKTIQLLSCLLYDRSRHGPAPVLLVCPTSVLGNWQREAARFTPDLPVRLFYGADRVLRLADQPLVLTSYALVWRDLEVLKGVRWRAVVLDEAQNVKNAETQQSRAIRQLEAEFRVALTGTPVENRLQELWSLMEFLNPGLLGNRASFARNYARPIEKEQSAEALERLRTLTRPFLLRRMKSDPAVAPDLPPKEEIKTYCFLTSEQASLYAAVLQEAMDQIESKEGVERRGLILKLLLQLKQVCDHPALISGDRARLDARSGKLVRLEEMLEELSEPALIFTQFAGFAQQLAAYFHVPCLHGGLSKAVRDRLVLDFQSSDGPRLMVLSLKAGGVGLNLTRATRVFHFDRWWNPAVENQATDRAYRIGQTQKVQVYKFICQGTLEDSIDEMMEKKRALAENVLSQDESWLTELDNSQLRELLELRG